MFIGTRIEQILSWNLFGTIKQKKKFTHTHKKFTHTQKITQTKKKIYTHTKFTHTYKKNILCQISLRK